MPRFAECFLWYHAPMADIYINNAKDDGGETRGWIVGSFIPLGLRHSDIVEVKYGVHAKGEVRTEWVTGEARTTLFILQSGRFTMRFRDKDAVLEKPGDYVMWGPGVDHRWEALEDRTGITVRWMEK
jgi:mannose-6-phosphate isomerase-like protein (cupin superfamily)